MGNIGVIGIDIVKAPTDNSNKLYVLLVIIPNTEAFKQVCIEYLIFNLFIQSLSIPQKSRASTITITCPCLRICITPSTELAGDQTLG